MENDENEEGADEQPPPPPPAPPADLDSTEPPEIATAEVERTASLQSSRGGAQEEKRTSLTSTPGGQQEKRSSLTSNQGGAEERRTSLESNRGGAQEEKRTSLTSTPGGQQEKRSSLTSNQGGAEERRSSLESNRGGAQEEKRTSLTSTPGGQQEKRSSLTSNQGGAEERRSSLESNRGGAQEKKRTSLTSTPGGQQEKRSSLTSNQGGAEERRVSLESNRGGAQEKRTSLTSTPGGQEEKRSSLTSNQGGTEEKRASLGSTVGGAQDEKRSSLTSTPGGQEKRSSLTSNQGGTEERRSSLESNRGGPPEEKRMSLTSNRGEGLPDRQGRGSKDEEPVGEGDETDEDEEGDEDEDKKHTSFQDGASSPTENRPTIRRKKHSISAHLQAEINKQKIAQAKQAREQRRSALGAQHVYLIAHVAATTTLKPKEVEEFVIDSQAYIDLMESFFEKKGAKALIFSYQEADPPGVDSGRPNVTGAKKEKMMRVMISDGSNIPLRGNCMYFVRLNNDNKITFKNITEEIYFGQLQIKDQEDAGRVLETLCVALNSIYLKYMKANNSWVTIPDPEMAAQVRHRFLTSIQHYAEFLMDSKNDIATRLNLREISPMDELIGKYMKTAEETIEAAKDPEIVAKVEHTVILWCKHIERVLALSKHMRKETDTMGPNTELAYWRNLMGKMCFIIEQVQTWRFVNFIQVLIHSKSKVLRRWKDVDARVTDEFHEAKDNVRYMYALDKFCEPLYQFDPPAMLGHISSMMYTIRTIHTTSRYYNSTEKVTALMVKISNQMVAACRRYLTNDGEDTIWGQDKTVMVEKLKKCLELYATYRTSYESTKAELEQSPDGKRFDFSVNQIFGRFEQFCDRLKKIIEVVEIFDMYSFIHISRIDGIEEIAGRLNNLFKNIQKESYDPLDLRDPMFDNDYATVRASLDEIEMSLEAFMEKAIENSSTALHGIQLLERFKNLRNRCLDIDGKQWYLFQFYHNEINLLKSIYEAEKNDTPVPRGFPPFAGKLAWCRHLLRRLERPMNWFRDNTDILTREEAKPTIKLYNAITKKLIYYEILFHDAFVKATPNVYDSLESPILCIRGNMRQELVLNFDPFFRQIIDETEIIRKMDPLEVPDIALIVYFKQDKLFLVYESMKGLLERFVEVKSQIPNDLMVLIRPLIKQVEKSFMPGVSTITWTSSKCDEYFSFVSAHLDELETMLRRVKDIISLRINEVLVEIAHTMMIDIQDTRPMPVQEYMDRIVNYSAIVAKDLEYKSRACESAAIELVNTLLATNDLPVPEELLYSWMNPTIFEKERGKTEGGDTTTTEKTSKGRSIGGINAMVAELSPSVRDELSHIHDECRHVHSFYAQKCAEALQKTTRISLDMLRKRTEEPQVSKRNPNVVPSIPLFTADLILTIPSIKLKPPIEDMQMVLTRSTQIVVEALKRVVIWGQTRRLSFDESTEESYYKDKEAVEVYQRLHAQEQLVRASIQVENLNSKLKNCYKPVMDYKDISKMMLMMQTVVTQCKPRVNELIRKYAGYNYLWRDERTVEIREMLAKTPAVTEVDAIIRKWRELQEEIEAIPVGHRIGPLEVMTADMKMGFQVELKEWSNLLCKYLAEEYHVKALEIANFIEECNKDLQNPIRDMTDILLVMTVLERIREHYVYYERLLTPIEEIYFFIGLQKYKVPDEDSNRAETLRHSFEKLQAKALEVQDKICSVQEANRKILSESVSKLQKDMRTYFGRYKTAGPMVEGLAPQEASDRLVMFQDEFDELWERYVMCNNGEKLFGLVPNEYPQLFKLQKELALLQKLYGLFNDVNRSIAKYYEIKCVNLDIQKVNAELTEFQSRCRRLPNALKEWPAFLELKKKIDDFNETCPLQELMTNK